MYQVMQSAGRPIKAWTQGVPVEPRAARQLRHVAELPFIHRHVAAMPDVHWGIGATVGSVIPTYGAIIPAAVGVDIGCGMTAVRLGSDLTAEFLPDNLKPMRLDIEAAVPVGQERHDVDGCVPKPMSDRPLDFRTIAALIDRHPKIMRRRKLSLEELLVSQLGTLGGGNHFVEVCVDESEHLWMMLHSGSRGIGHALGTYFIALAKDDMRRHFINLPDENLAYVVDGTEHYEDYLTAVGWAQAYAKLNRETMMQRILAVLAAKYFPRLQVDREAIDCHHNYVALENHFGKNVHVTRKGAVRARRGDLGIIPGSMGARSYIVAGKGNPDAFNSCSHGAGRAMSRSEAKRVFSMDDHREATVGVECRKDSGVLDETPGAYKSIDAVMAAQDDLVSVLHTLKQVICIKG